MPTIETPITYRIVLPIEDIKCLLADGFVVRRIPLKKDIKFIDVTLELAKLDKRDFEIIIKDDHSNQGASDD